MVSPKAMILIVGNADTFILHSPLSILHSVKNRVEGELECFISV